jgi:hypothetical protein
VGEFVPAHSVTEDGLVFLNAWEPFVLQRGRPDC